jgi:hypothetical protein
VDLNHRPRLISVAWLGFTTTYKTAGIRQQQARGHLTKRRLCAQCTPISPVRNVVKMIFILNARKGLSKRGGADRNARLCAYCPSSIHDCGLGLTESQWQFLAPTFLSASFHTLFVLNFALVLVAIPQDLERGTYETGRCRFCCHFDEHHELAGLRRSDLRKPRLTLPAGHHHHSDADCSCQGA